jgi:hypothetical protein
MRCLLLGSRTAACAQLLRTPAAERAVRPPHAAAAARPAAAPGAPLQRAQAASRSPRRERRRQRRHDVPQAADMRPGRDLGRHEHDLRANWGTGAAGRARQVGGGAARRGAARARGAAAGRAATRPAGRRSWALDPGPPGPSRPRAAPRDPPYAPGADANSPWGRGRAPLRAGRCPGPLVRAIRAPPPRAARRPCRRRPPPPGARAAPARAAPAAGGAGGGAGHAGGVRPALAGARRASALTLPDRGCHVGWWWVGKGVQARRLGMGAAQGGGVPHTAATPATHPAGVWPDDRGFDGAPRPRSRSEAIHHPSPSLPVHMRALWPGNRPTPIALATPRVRPPLPSPPSRSAARTDRAAPAMATRKEVGAAWWGGGRVLQRAAPRRGARRSTPQRPPGAPLRPRRRRARQR